MCVGDCVAESVTVYMVVCKRVCVCGGDNTNSGDAGWGHSSGRFFLWGMGQRKGKRIRGEGRREGEKIPQSFLDLRK